MWHNIYTKCACDRKPLLKQRSIQFNTFERGRTCVWDDTWLEIRLICAGRCACFMETQERLGKEHKLHSLMEAVLRTLAAAKSGLHLAFVIRAGLFTPWKSPRLSKEGETKSRMKANLTERNERVVVACENTTATCIIYTLWTLWVCFCAYQAVFLFQVEFGSIHYKVQAICEITLLSLGGFHLTLFVSRESAPESTVITSVHNF